LEELHKVDSDLNREEDLEDQEDLEDLAAEEEEPPEAVEHLSKEDDE
jgi:sensor domain CHASE-containing protein